MRIDADTIPDYIAALESERAEAISGLLDVLRRHLPPGFTETMQYGVPSFVVGLDRYPAGYHCSPEDPLPFISVASRKRYIALYHMGIYADGASLAWFENAWPTYVPTKLDMGKSCIRFARPDRIPFELIGQLAERMTVDEWIALYETSRMSQGGQ